MPPCVFRYASITSAAAAAVSGDDSLVPPSSWRPDGLPLSSRQVFGLQSIQLRSPGATRLTVLPPDCEKPPDEMLEMLLSIQVPLVAFGTFASIPPCVSC